MISCYYSSQVAELFAVIYARTQGGPGAGEKMTTAEGMLFKGVKLRLYPSRQQHAMLLRWRGSLRRVWNDSLDWTYKFREAEGRWPKSNELKKFMLSLKTREETPWLAELPTLAVHQMVPDLRRALKNWFEKRAKKPKFRGKYDRQFSIYIANTTSGFIGNRMKLPKLGTVKYRGGSLPDGRLYSARVFMEAGKWFASAVFECRPLDPSIAPVERVGIDMGIKTLATVYDGSNVVSIENPKALHANLAKLRRYQRMVSRRQKGSKRRELAKRRVANIHQRITNIRKDACHKATTDVVRNANSIVVESLNVKGMMKNGNLARSVADASMSTFLGMLAYKAQWHGRSVIEVSQWMPSTRTCSRCGQLHDMPLSSRWMSCDCGNEMDRDENAARNLYAYREEPGKVCDMKAQKTRGETGDQVHVATHEAVPVVEPRTHAKCGDIIGGSRRVS